MELETELIAECARTADAQEGMAAAAFLAQAPTQKFIGR